MAQEMLNKVLNSNISPKQIIDWLTSENYNDTKWIQFNEKCQREEFITFYLNYLRDQFTSVLQTSTVSKQVPAKTNVAQTKIVKTVEPTKISGVSRKINPDFDVKILNDNDDQTLNIYNHISFPELSASPTDNHSSSSKKTISYTNMCKNMSTPVRQNSNNLIKESPKNNQSLNTSIMNSANEHRNNLGNISLSSQPNTSPIEVCSSKKTISYSSMCKNSTSTPNKQNISDINNKTQKRKKKPKNNQSFEQQCESTPNKQNVSNVHNETPKNKKNSNSNFKNSAEGHKNSPGQNLTLPQQHSSPVQISSPSPNIASHSNSCKNATSTPIRRNPTRIATDEKGNKENTVFGVVSRPFTQNPQFVNVSPIDKSVDNESFKIERGLVKIERQKKPEPTVNTDKPVNDENNQPRFKILQRTPNKVTPASTIVIPNRLLVDSVENLNILAELYSGFLDHNLILNPMTELYFIIQLITTQYSINVSSDTKNVDTTDDHNKEVSEDLSSAKKNLSQIMRKSLNFDDSLENIKFGDKDIFLNKSIDELGCLSIDEESKESSNQINTNLKEFSLHKSDVISEKSFEEVDVTRDCIKLYLQSPHNCVYFSTQVLNHQRAFLKCLDRVTLKLLCENNQISTFQPDLCKYLDSIYSNKVTESHKFKSVYNNVGSGELNVCFQIDTDNKTNFPSSTAFQNFRKQRDMFYEILKIWEDNHLVPGWTFQIALSGKIKSMLSMHVDVTNFTHFSRLFKSQMLMSCIESGQQDLLDDETESVLKNLKVSNPEKLNQLQRKLVTPLSQNGPVPLPSFPGIQEFYKDFILFASSQMFYVYLEDTFIHEIMELTTTKFAGSDIEETETDVDEQTKQNFVICLTSLRLLSKFLGFITSLPYRSETSMMPEVITAQVSLRSKCFPRIDLQHCLKTAVMEGKLSLTVPWIVEYLAMMDHASLRLPYYKRILEMLYCVYRAANYCAVINSSEFMSLKASILVKFAIGWLFALPNFPTELYYTCQSKYSDKTLNMMCDSSQVNNTDYSIDEAESSVVSVKHSLFLDKLQMIDDRILYSCCPYLKELNILLTPGNSSVNSSISCRHVTPVTSQLQKPIKKANIKHLEIQLEEAFFHGQPMSTRKTVEYVSERVASSCVKYICNALLPVERQKSCDELKKSYEELQKSRDTLKINNEQIKKMLAKDISLLSAKAAEAVKVESEKVIPKMCESRITQSIESLLAEDSLIPVKNMCAKIAFRMAMERIDQWTQSHIVGDSTFMKNLKMELDTGFKNNDEVPNNRDHNPNVAAPTDIIHVLRSYIWDLLELKGASLTIDAVSNFWDQLFECFTKRSDLKLLAEKTISYLSIDFCLLLMTHRNDLFTSEVQNKMVKAWKVETVQISEPDSPLLRILSPRNITMLSTFPGNGVWVTCGKFLKLLLEEHILPIDSLSEQAVSVFRIEWPVPIMKNLSRCLKEAIDGYKSSDEETERIRYLLGWVAGAYNDMDLGTFGTF